jgi:hypothetical protein
MALILVAQNELWDKFKLQQYAAIRQRIDIRCQLPELDRSQTGAYIERHLEYAGTADIFTDKAIEEIYKYSAGSMRSINRACTHELIFAAQHAKRLIDDHMMRAAMRKKEYDKLVSAYEDLRMAYDYARYVCDELKQNNDILRSLCYTNGVEVSEEPCGYDYLPTEEFLYDQRRDTASCKRRLQRICDRRRGKGR